jgi:hypothetical protein
MLSELDEFTEGLERSGIALADRGIHRFGVVIEPIAQLAERCQFGFFLILTRLSQLEGAL